jgi:predicted metalloprotease with PDZ domain
MVRVARAVIAVLIILASASIPVLAQAPAPVAYHLTFPEREHRLMDVAITLADLPEGPLELRMSRSSPGRYAVHEFAKNVFNVRVTDGSGRRLAVSRPNPSQWNVSGHSGIVHVTYRVFGDRVDGTYLGIDGTHAHINMPAALMWARGLQLRPTTVRFELPEGTSWRIATQLLPGPDEYTYTAPNLQYLMDSPTELSDFALRTFPIAEGGRVQTIRLAVHHHGTDADLDGFVKDIAAIVRESRHVFGEYPDFEGDTYTFIADYLPWASSDGMEHRNSTILTSPSSIASNRLGLLNTVAHEFVHAWNVERIRPQSLEPFDFEDANISEELWFGEGFTSYYASLLLQRAGLTTVADFAADVGRTISTVVTSPARALRTPVEMSQMAPFVDAATFIDRTNFDTAFLSYYTWGAAIGLGLDLLLRDRSNGDVTLDHYMRAMWQEFGKPASRLSGYVERPYSMADLERTLAKVAGDAAFARDFFARYVQGHEAIEYGPLLARAGFVLRSASPRQGFAGTLRLQDGQRGVRVTGTVPLGSPAYDAGLGRDDVIVSVDGRSVGSAIEVYRAIQAGRPGDALPIVFEHRGHRVSTVLRLVENPRLEVVPGEQAGQAPREAERRFREAWLGPARGDR